MVKKPVPFVGDPTPQERIRFWRHVDTTHETGCWIWNGAKTNTGYGKFNYRGRAVLAHRFAWYLTYGENPPLDELDHKCMTKNCVNVTTHLKPSTSRDNNMRSNSAAALNARKTHCKFGHAFSEENTYVYSSGRRRCRECSKTYDGQRYKKRYEEEKQKNTHTSEMRDFAASPKISQEIAEEIRNKYSLGNTSQRILAREYKVSQPLIGQIINNKVWIKKD